jgi:hypothetical protein
MAVYSDILAKYRYIVTADTSPKNGCEVQILDRTHNLYVYAKNA